MMTQLHPKPLPSATILDRPYWEHAQRHELALQKCSDCGQFRYPASPVCPECDGAKYDWTRVSGKGCVISWVIFHRCYFPSFEDEMPYNVALIQLDEGPVVISNIVDIDNDEIASGLRVEVVFDDVDEQISIPKFRSISQ